MVKKQTIPNESEPQNVILKLGNYRIITDEILALHVQTVTGRPDVYRIRAYLSSGFEITEETNKEEAFAFGNAWTARINLVYKTEIPMMEGDK